jgi:hypothetical protein
MSEIVEEKLKILEETSLALIALHHHVLICKTCQPINNKTVECKMTLNCRHTIHTDVALCSSGRELKRISDKLYQKTKEF